MPRRWSATGSSWRPASPACPSDGRLFPPLDLADALLDPEHHLAELPHAEHQHAEQDRADAGGQRHQAEQGDLGERDRAPVREQDLGAVDLAARVPGVDRGQHEADPREQGNGPGQLHEDDRELEEEEAHAPSIGRGAPPVPVVTSAANQSLRSTFWARGPFSLCTTSNSTSWPSLRVLKPSCWMA